MRFCSLILMSSALGSFLNVCIYRIPRRESIAYPPSHCPDCGHQLSARELIPVLSWLWQRGRCRHCGSRISWRYPAVELLTALLLTLWMAARSSGRFTRLGRRQWRHQTGGTAAGCQALAADSLQQSEFPGDFGLYVAGCRVWVWKVR